MSSLIVNATRTAGSAVVIAAVIASCNEEFHFDIQPDPDGGDEGGAETDGAVAIGPCTTDATCAGIRCDAPSGTCVQCLDDDDCSGSLPRCDTTSRICVACIAKADCTKREDCEENRCIDACFDADDCSSAGFSCNDNNGLCVECTSDANCSASANGPICNVAIGRCVHCTGNAECTDPTPVCDLRNGQCQQCVVSTTCGDSEICDPSTLTCRNRF